jgi:hypothetical protein
MGTFVFFVLLLSCTAVFSWRIRRGLTRIARVGVGGPDEDLDAARRSMMSVLVSGLVAATSLGAAVLTEARWGSPWRDTLPGEVFLNGLVILAVLSVVWTGGYTTRQQWSRDGSIGGMIRGMFYSVMALAGLALAMSWRWG